GLGAGGGWSGPAPATLTISAGAGGDAGDYRAVVTNAFGSATSDAATLTVNRPPAATITAPAAGTRYTHGQTILFAGTADDPEDGALPAGAYTWRVDFGHHTHFHPHVPPTSGITGGSFVASFAGTSAHDVYPIHPTLPH